LLVDPLPETVIGSGDKIRVFGLPEQIRNFTPAAGLKKAV